MGELILSAVLAARIFYDPGLIDICLCDDPQPAIPRPAPGPVALDVLLALLTAVLVLALAGLVYRACAASLRARRLAACVLPAIPLLLCALPGALGWAHWQGVPEGLLAVSAWHLFVNSSALTVCNFLALPSPLCFGLAADTPRLLSSTPLWMNLLLLLGVQAGLVWLSAHYARVSVQRGLDGRFQAATSRPATGAVRCARLAATAAWNSAAGATVSLTTAS